MSINSKNGLSIGIFILAMLVVLISLAARLYDLKMDPFAYNEYGTSWGDEGHWVHQARNKVLFGNWELEGHTTNPMYISPVFNYLEYISFKTLDVSTFSTRIVPAVLGIISVLFASFLLFLKNKKEGIVYFIFLSINTMLVAYSRVGMLESAVLFFVLIILGLVIYDKYYSWALAGFFAPFLFFSKMTSMFFIMAVPVSVVLYYLLYRQKQTLRNFYYLLVGGLISSVLWLFWMIPNFEGWYFMNFGSYNSYIFMTLTKPIGSIFFLLQYSLINQLISIIVLVWIFFTARSLIKREKVEYLDFFLIAVLFLFYLQTTVADLALRRFVVIVPILLLISTRLICKIQDFGINLNNNKIKISGNKVIFLLVFVYVLINFIQLGTYFYELRLDYEGAHTHIRNSKEINNYIPAGSRVYGSLAASLALESNIKPYFTFDYRDNPHNINQLLPMLSDGEMPYAILDRNIFDISDIEKKRKIKLDESKVLTYITNNFEIIGVLNGKDPRDNSLSRKIYIYKKKGS